MTKWTLRMIAACLFSTTAIFAQADDRTRPTVDIDGAVWEGAYVSPDDKRAMFKGLPYAAPPTGDLRWRPPQAATVEPGFRPARAFGPACVQAPRLVTWDRRILEKLGKDSHRLPAYANVSNDWTGVDAARIPDLVNVGEDCLYLNVWTPDLAAEQGKPVMVWIYGGSNVSGYAHQVVYDGAALADKDVVVVTFNYRVGAFGFFSHPALSAESDAGVSGNYATLDHIAALEWVQDNIERFGGDPDNVTIFGESAGAVNVATLIASPLADGLFHRAIVQSGVFTALRSLEDDEKIGAAILESLGVAADLPTEQALADMRALAPGDIFHASAKVRGDAYYGPIVDGWVLPDQPQLIYSTGRAHNVPVMIGVTRDEFSLFLPGEVNEQRYQGTVEFLAQDPENAAAIHAATAGEPDPFKRTVRVMTDAWFLCGSKQAAKDLSKQQQNVYFYLFDKVRDGAEVWVGAYHAGELAYLFGTVDRLFEQTDADKALADVIQGYWTNFATHGDPNGANLPDWPPVTPDRDTYIVLDDKISLATGLEAEICSALGAS